MSVLLVYPPFAAAHIPPLAVAQLVAHLRAQEIAARGLDLNNAFYRWAFAPGRLRAAAAAGGDPAAFAALQPHLDTLLTPPARYSPLMENRKLGLAAAVYSGPQAPESFSIDWPGVEFNTPYDVYNSADLLRGAAVPGLFGTFFDEVLAPELSGVRVLGISVSWPVQILPALRLAAAARRLRPGLRIVLGGSFIAACCRPLTAPGLFTLVDGLVDGDGELALTALARDVAPAEVPGLVRVEHGVVVRNPPAAPLPLDTLPAPDYADFDFDGYLAQRHALWLPLRLTRGCQWGRCTFCRTDLVARCAQPAVETALGWIRAVVRQSGIRALNFTDDEASPALLAELAPRLIAGGDNILWTATHRFEECLTPERCRLYHASGCRFLFLGLESCTDRILRLMNKGITLALVERTLANLRDAGIRAHAFVIVGFPGETEDEALAGYERLRGFVRAGLLHSYNYSAFLLLPHSPIDDNRAAFGISGVAPAAAGRDLDCIRDEFTAAGMTRARARELMQQFNAGRSA